jgi:hypothetical protein
MSPPAGGGDDPLLAALSRLSAQNEALTAQLGDVSAHARALEERAAQQAAVARQHALRALARCLRRAAGTLRERRLRAAFATLAHALHTSQSADRARSGMQRVSENWQAALQRHKAAAANSLALFRVRAQGRAVLQAWHAAARQQSAQTRLALVVATGKASARARGLVRHWAQAAHRQRRLRAALAAMAATLQRAACRTALSRWRSGAEALLAAQCRSSAAALRGSQDRAAAAAVRQALGTWRRCTAAARHDAQLQRIARAWREREGKRQVLRAWLRQLRAQRTMRRVVARLAHVQATAALHQWRRNAQAAAAMLQQREAQQQQLLVQARWQAAVRPVMARLLGQVAGRSARTAFESWVAYVRQVRTQRRALAVLLQRRDLRPLRHAFVRWRLRVTHEAATDALQAVRAEHARAALVRRRLAFMLFAWRQHAVQSRLIAAAAAQAQEAQVRAALTRWRRSCKLALAVRRWAGGASKRSTRLVFDAWRGGLAAQRQSEQGKRESLLASRLARSQLRRCLATAWTAWRQVAQGTAFAGRERLAADALEETWARLRRTAAAALLGKVRRLAAQRAFARWRDQVGVAGRVARGQARLAALQGWRLQQRALFAWMQAAAVAAVRRRMGRDRAAEWRVLRDRMQLAALFRQWREQARARRVQRRVVLRLTADSGRRLLAAAFAQWRHVAVHLRETEQQHAAAAAERARAQLARVRALGGLLHRRARALQRQALWRWAATASRSAVVAALGSAAQQQLAAAAAAAAAQGHIAARFSRARSTADVLVALQDCVQHTLPGVSACLWLLDGRHSRMWTLVQAGPFDTPAAAAASASGAGVADTLEAATSHTWQVSRRSSVEQSGAAFRPEHHAHQGGGTFTASAGLHAPATSGAAARLTITSPVHKRGRSASSAQAGAGAVLTPMGTSLRGGGARGAARLAPPSNLQLLETGRVAGPLAGSLLGPQPGDDDRMSSPSSAASVASVAGFGPGDGASGTDDDRRRLPHSSAGSGSAVMRVFCEMRVSIAGAAAQMAIEEAGQPLRSPAGEGSLPLSSASSGGMGGPGRIILGLANATGDSRFDAAGDMAVRVALLRHGAAGPADRVACLCMEVAAPLNAAALTQLLQGGGVEQAVAAARRVEAVGEVALRVQHPVAIVQLARVMRGGGGSATDDWSAAELRVMQHLSAALSGSLVLVGELQEHGSKYRRTGRALREAAGQAKTAKAQVRARRRMRSRWHVWQHIPGPLAQQSRRFTLPVPSFVTIAAAGIGAGVGGPRPGDARSHRKGGGAGARARAAACPLRQVARVSVVALWLEWLVGGFGLPQPCVWLPRGVGLSTGCKRAGWYSAQSCSVRATPAVHMRRDVNTETVLLRAEVAALEDQAAQVPALSAAAQAAVEEASALREEVAARDRDLAEVRAAAFVAGLIAHTETGAPHPSLAATSPAGHTRSSSGAVEAASTGRASSPAVRPRPGLRSASRGSRSFSPQAVPPPPAATRSASDAPGDWEGSSEQRAVPDAYTARRSRDMAALRVQLAAAQSDLARMRVSTASSLSPSLAGAGIPSVRTPPRAGPLRRHDSSAIAGRSATAGNRSPVAAARLPPPRGVP